jgi:galactokinase/CTP:molybdopterin cytidylyltransferase MocA
LNSGLLSKTLNTFDLQQLLPLRLADVKAVVASNREMGVLDCLSAAEGDLNARSLIFRLVQVYGQDVDRIEHQVQRVVSMSHRFADLYGAGPVTLLRAPARINIMGEHVDYVSYLPTESLPFGSREHDMLMMIRGGEADEVRGASSAAKYPTFSFPLSDGPPFLNEDDVDSAWLSYLYEHPAAAPHWSNYVKGPAYFSRIQLGKSLKRGFNFVVDSEIPAGGGASSSSALVVLANAALRIVNGISYAPLELARDSSKAEWYVGTRGGAMDHITISMAKRDHAVLISFANQQAEQINLPGQDYRWVTFFSKPADKGREVMIEYNERAAVSRILLPALIEGWKQTQPHLYQRWQLANQSLDDLDEIERLINELPETLTLAELSRDRPDAFSECSQSFPALVSERAEHPLRIRARALHHLGEIRRVKTATKVLKGLSDTDAAMKSLGNLLDQTHESLRDLYEVSTPDVEQLIEIIRTTSGVYGARLMGGGFGGNVLVLTKKAVLDSLIERVQLEYYAPAGRNGVAEGSVMVSTPGDGLARIESDNVWCGIINEFNSLPHESEHYRASINNLLDRLPVTAEELHVWPIIVAAGKGTRSVASGLTTPKPVAPVLGVPAIVHVLKNLRAAFGATPTPIVIVSPETESVIRECLKDEVTIVVQDQALGTGDAVLRAHAQMENFTGRALVIWGTQPVVQPETMRRTMKLASLFHDFDMVIPTVFKDMPYAPIVRNTSGKVESARETHLENAGKVSSGETNIGMFLLKSSSMFAALLEINRKYWDETESRYKRPGGELGFPNELINYFAVRENGVFACPIADSREEQGIKTLSDIDRCEQFISEFKSRVGEV